MSEDRRSEAKLRIGQEEAKAKARITALVEAGEKLLNKYTSPDIPLKKRVSLGKRFGSDFDFWAETSKQLLIEIFTNRFFVNEYMEIDPDKSLYFVAEELLAGCLDYMQSMIDRIEFIPQE